MKMFNKNDFTLAEGATHVGNSKNKSKFAFTLAEVLVTLGIIGVVAVLTVPNVISSYQKKVYVAQLQKAYNQISNAVALLMVDEEVDNLNDTYLYCDRDVEERDVCLERVGFFLKKYFKVAKDCGQEDELDCFADKVDPLAGEGFGADGFLSGTYCVFLNSGATLCLRYPHRHPLAVYLDINGMKKPNIWGRDAFQFSVNYKGDIAETFDTSEYGKEYYHPDRCEEKSAPYSNGCFNKIIQDGWKMDY